MNILHLTVQILVLILCLGLIGVALNWALSKYPIPQTIVYIIMGVVGIIALIALVHYLGMGDVFYLPIARAD